MNAALDALATELYVVIDDLLLDHPHLAPPRPSVGIAPQLTTALTGPNRFEVGAMDPDDATDPAQQPSAEIIELVGVYHGSYGRQPGRASRTGRAGGVPRDPAQLRREVDRAAEALGLIWPPRPHPSASETGRTIEEAAPPSSELRLGSTVGEEARMVDDSRHETFVIAGASLAGATAAAALREEGFSGRIVLVGEEHERPYERPPLSKDYLQGRSEREKIFVHPADWYAQHDAELQLGTRVTRVDAGAHELTVADGKFIRYDKLLLCTGSSPRPLPVPGAEVDGVLYLRTVGDSERIMEILASVSRVAVVGAGWIGLEVTAAARNAGVDVTLLEMMELPLLRVLGPEVAQVFAELHRSHGVDLRFGVHVEEIIGRGGRVAGVRLAGGGLVEAEAVVVGVGITPNTELAVAAGLRVDNGVVVDEHLRSSDPDICAAGDVANAFHPLLGRHIRVEHWANAVNQPKTAAKTMLGVDAVYDRVPYFFTDQYELSMEYSGYVEPRGYDEVVFRGDPKDGEYIAFWVQDGRVLAGMNVNVWEVTDAIQALVRSRRPVDIARLSDPDVPLTDVAGEA